MDGDYLPQELAIEQSVLCACMLDTEAAKRAIARIGPPTQDTEQVFYSPANQLMYQAIYELVSNGQIADLAMLHSWLSHPAHYHLEAIGGLGYLYQIYEAEVTAVKIDHHIDRLTDTYSKRLLLREAERFSELAQTSDRPASELITESLSRMQGLAQSSHKGKVEYSFTSIADRLMVRPTGPPEGTCYSGLVSLDNAMGGLRPGELAILLGEPGSGKSCLALMWAVKAAAQGLPVLFVSLEMTADDIGCRILAQQCGVNLFLAGHTQELLDKAGATLAELKDALATLTIRDDLHSATAINAEVVCGDYALVVVDYLQLVGSDNPQGTQEAQISSISRMLKQTALSKRVPMLVLSSVNRASSSKTGPDRPMDRIRHSHGTSHDADSMLLVSAEELIIAKARNGKPGQHIPVCFDGSRFLFKEANTMAGWEANEQW